MPRMPVAPSAATLSSAVPPLLQSEGASGMPGPPMSCMGTEAACSPASRTETLDIVPQA